MNKHFIIADTHFYHNNIITYCNRPFSSVEEMNEKLIENWNSVVGKNDVVFILGDFTLTRNQEKIKAIVERLNGRKRLIYGNHDLLKPEKYMELGFESAIIYPVLYNKHIFFSHEPIPTEERNDKWIYFFGHVHDSTLYNDTNNICVSADQINFTPYQIDYLISDINIMDVEYNNGVIVTHQSCRRR